MFRQVVCFGRADSLSRNSVVRRQRERETLEDGGSEQQYRLSNKIGWRVGRQVRLFTNWRLTAATKQRAPDDADLCSLCALKMLLADQEVLARAIISCRRD